MTARPDQGMEQYLRLSRPLGLRLRLLWTSHVCCAGGSSGSLSTPAATITIPSHSPGHKYGHGGRNFALELKRKQSNSLPQVGVCFTQQALHLLI